MCCVVYWRLHHHGESSDPLKSGTKRVIISALSADVPMLVMDIDHEITHDCQQCLLHYQLLRPPGKGLHDSFGITEGSMTTVPACTDTLATVESPDDCGTAQSIITESTGPAN